MTDELANDRTFLAWLRTGISVAGLGFVVAKFALLLEQFGHHAHAHNGLSTITGVILVLAGGALIAFGYRQHARVQNVLRERGITVAADAHWPLATTVIAVAGTVILAVLVTISNTTAA